MIDHTLQVQAQHVVDDVEACAAEVAEYLNDHSHWQQPIFPDEVGCSRLIINPPYFNTSGTFWNCYNQLPEGKNTEGLSYGLECKYRFISIECICVYIMYDRREYLISHKSMANRSLL